MDQLELKVANREILGKKVRFLRRQYVTPVHLFGHAIKSVALQCDTAKLQHVLAQAGQTRLVNLKLDNEKSPRTVLVREVQREPLTRELLHVDFYQVKMEEKIRIEIPIVLVGEAPVLKLKGNTLTQELNTLTVESFPAKIPASIELDVSSLTEPEQAVRVKDIELDEEITIVNDQELVVVKASSRPVEKIEEAVEIPEAAPLPEEQTKEE